MGTETVIVVAAIVVAATAFLIYGFVQEPRRRRETTDEGYGPLDHWPAQAAFAEMRKEGASLPDGDEGNRSERPT